MKKDVKYYAVHDLKKIIATTQRTASVSMIEAMQPMQLGSHVTKLAFVSEIRTFKNMSWPVLLWIRYPLDRLASAYTIFGQSNFEDFIRRVLDETNPHWSPVSKLHSLGKDFIPTHVYAFENLHKTWAIEMPGYELGHWDKTPTYRLWNELMRDLPTPLYEQLLNLFHDDFALHRWAIRDGVHQVAA